MADENVPRENQGTDPDGTAPRYGSEKNPIQFDPFRTINSVGWSNRDTYILVWLGARKGSVTDAVTGEWLFNNFVFDLTLKDAVDPKNPASKKKRASIVWKKLGWDGGVYKGVWLLSANPTIIAKGQTGGGSPIFTLSVKGCELWGGRTPDPYLWQCGYVNLPTGNLFFDDTPVIPPGFYTREQYMTYYQAVYNAYVDHKTWGEINNADDERWYRTETDYFFGISPPPGGWDSIHHQWIWPNPYPDHAFQCGVTEPPWTDRWFAKVNDGNPANQWVEYPYGYWDADGVFQTEPWPCGCSHPEFKAYDKLWDATCELDVQIFPVKDHVVYPADWDNPIRHKDPKTKALGDPVIMWEIYSWLGLWGSGIGGISDGNYDFCLDLRPYTSWEPSAPTDKPEPSIRQVYPSTRLQNGGPHGGVQESFYTVLHCRKNINDKPFPNDDPMGFYKNTSDPWHQIKGGQPPPLRPDKLTR